MMLLALILGVVALDFDAAKARADADEASLTPTQTRALTEAQGHVIGGAFQACLQQTGVVQPPDFAIVIQLDAAGNVIKTWQRGGSPFVTCVRKHVDAARLFAPPRAGFYTSMVFTFDREA